MKKGILLGMLFCAVTAQAEQTFKNPVFSSPLQLRETYEKIAQHPKAQNDELDCHLVENTDTYIQYDCVYPKNNPQSNITYRYTSIGKTLYEPDYCSLGLEDNPDILPQYGSSAMPYLLTESTSCGATVEVFKNPLFYSFFHDESQNPHYVFTPTSIRIWENLRKSPQSVNCQLLENNLTNILLRCEENEKTTYFKLVSLGSTEKSLNQCYIKLYTAATEDALETTSPILLFTPRYEQFKPLNIPDESICGPVEKYYLNPQFKEIFESKGKYTYDFHLTPEHQTEMAGKIDSCHLIENLKETAVIECSYQDKAGKRIFFKNRFTFIGSTPKYPNDCVLHVTDGQINKDTYEEKYLGEIILPKTECLFKAEPFKTPIFNEILRGYDEHSFEYKLMPWSIITLDAGPDYCFLLENSETSLTYKCPSKNNSYLQYISIGKTKEYPDRCVILLRQASSLSRLDDFSTSKRFVYWENCGTTEAFKRNKK